MIVISGLLTEEPLDRVLQELRDITAGSSSVHKIGVAEVRPRLCLMGNVAPLEIGVHGTPEQVRAAAAQVIAESNGGEGLILSTGGGASPSMPAANIRALCEAAKKA